MDYNPEMERATERAMERRLNWAHRLETQQPERFCWASLTSSFSDLHTAEHEVGQCREDARHCGSCWCGKWESTEDGNVRLSKP